MKIKVDQPLKTMEGAVIKKGNSKEDFQLKDACVNVLMIDDTKGNGEGEEKVNRFLLATKISKANELELKAEEVTIIKEAMGKYAPTLWVGQAYNMLEGGKNPLDKETDETIK